MTSKKISQMTQNSYAPSRYDRLPIITPDTSPGTFKNASVPLRAVWSPTLLVDLDMQGSLSQNGVANNWSANVVVPSDDAEWDGGSSRFNFLTSGLFEATIALQLYRVDSYGAMQDWDSGDRNIYMSLNHGYTQMVPEMNPGTVLVGQSHYTFMSSGQVRIYRHTEKFWFNINESDTDKFFKIGAGVASATISENYEGSIGVAIKRIADPHNPV